MQTCKIIQTYVDKDNPLLGILAEAKFVILSEKNRYKVYSQGQLVFGRDMIILTKHTVVWKIIYQQKQK